MQTRITARHCEASDGLRAHIASQLGKLERVYDRIHDAHVILQDDPSPAADKRVEIALSVYRQTLKASDTGPTHAAAVDGCVRQLRRQVSRYKGRVRSRKGNGTPRP
ncbi:MAG TPA: ribosome-associated translation inhibitor RaiA [Rubricoccaceae bacterium]|jgi:putative sigma-54 modulation protein|nr:ribosome-associated translation inhibitor RaiA [Rubricoccaceae bacterium]